MGILCLLRAEIKGWSSQGWSQTCYLFEVGPNLPIILFPGLMNVTVRISEHGWDQEDATGTADRALGNPRVMK